MNFFTIAQEARELADRLNKAADLLEQDGHYVEARELRLEASDQYYRAANARKALGVDGLLAG